MNILHDVGQHVGFSPGLGSGAGFGGLTADDWVSVIAVVMVLTLILGRGITSGTLVSRQTLPALVVLVVIWAAIISLAAIAFQNFRPGGL